MLRPAIAAMAALSLSACVATAPPVVTDFNGASVKINTDLMAAYPTPPATAEANRICAMDGKRAEYASTRPIPNTGYEHLYLCL